MAFLAVLQLVSKGTKEPLCLLLQLHWPVNELGTTSVPVTISKWHGSMFSLHPEKGSGPSIGNDKYYTADTFFHKILY